MLKSVRCGVEPVFVRNVHWLQALAAATSIVSLAPRSSSEAKSTAYDTDIVEPLLVSGSVTFSADATDEQPSRTKNSVGLARLCGADTTNVVRPRARTAATYRRPASGRSFILLTA